MKYAGHRQYCKNGRGSKLLQNQNSLLVKRQNDNTSPRGPVFLFKFLFMKSLYAFLEDHINYIWGNFQFFIRMFST